MHNKIQLNSSVIVQVQWTRNSATDRDNGTLRVWFVSGKVYDYLDVSWSTYKYLIVWPSAGHYYNRHIRGKYHCVRRHGYLVRKALLNKPYTDNLFEQLSRSVAAY